MRISGWVPKALGALVSVMLSNFTVRAQLKTVEDRVAEFGEVVRQRLESDFRAAGVPYPPKRLTLIGIKEARSLEIFAADDDDHFHFIRAYSVLGASGKLGPKLREGDEQVPEGIYRVRELNPNSRFHLSLWLDYPNGVDRFRAIVERRSDLGGEIMIHGDAVSKGCLAVGDAAAEDLFVLAALIGIKNVKVILTPVDFRKKSTQTNLPNESSLWIEKLYQELAASLAYYPRSRS